MEISMKHYFFFTLLLLVSPYLAAEQKASTSYKGEKEASTQLQEKVEKAVVPISTSLAYLLTTTLPPSADGKPRPLGISIEPTDPVKPDEPIQAIVFHCAFSRATCEPFFRACASLHLKCTGGDGPTP